jgi:hypothetical protein
MSYYDALNQIWPSLQGANTAAKLAALNAMNVAGPKRDVNVSTVQGKLMLAGAWLKLKVYATSAGPAAPYAQMLLDMCGSPALNTFQMSDAGTYTAVQEMLGALATDPNSGVSAAISAELLALADSVVPWWQANGYRRPINMGDIVVTGLDTTTGYSVQIGAPGSNKFNVSVSVTVTGPKTVETDTTFASTLDEDYSKFFAANCIQNMMTRDTSLATFG